MSHFENQYRNSAGDGSWRSTGLFMGSVAAILIAADQLSKGYFTRWLGPEAHSHRYDLVGESLGFEYVRNTGVAFGMLQGRQWLVSLLAIIVLVTFLVAFGRELPGDRLLQLAVGMVAGGAIGNLIDRFRLGYVVDFIAVGSFPRFNIADSAVTIGLILLIWFLIQTDQANHSDQPRTYGNDEHDIA